MSEFVEQNRQKRDLRFGISIGPARLKADGVTLEELLDEAEQRLHANKAGHDSFQKFANTGDVMMTRPYGGNHVGL